MNDWLSDSLCRAVTGDGDVRRKLYADSDPVAFAFRRCLILTGIDLGAMNGDLSDRLLPIHLDVIQGDERLEESSMWPRWEEAHPRSLGPLLTSVAGVLARLPSTRLATKPRMADFARILGAIDQMCGSSGLDRYPSKQSTLASEALRQIRSSRPCSHR